MSKLVNIPQINQNQLLFTYKFAIKEKQSVLVIGPSGAGKTEMAFQACGQNDLNCIYWNLSVMERPDIQGLPAVSNDRKTATFAPIEHMPFVGMDKIRNERKLNKIVSSIDEHNPDFSYFLKEAKIQLSKLRNDIAISAIKDCAELFDKTELAKKDINPNVIGNEVSDNVLLLDEADKSPPENLQPLLELLLYRSVNDRPLDIQSCILTANLPDEHTYSEPLSHAITNRVMVFELVPDHDIWLNWGKKRDLHPMVIGFLSREENAVDFFNKRPANNSMYNYNYTSPRSWTQASDVMKRFDKYDENENISELRNKFLASIIGTDATAKLDVWFKYYKKYEKLIDAVYNGENARPPRDDDGADSQHATIVVAIAVANKFLQFAKKTKDSGEVQKKAAHIFNWINNNCPKEVAVCAFRSSFDPDVFKGHDLHSFETTKKMWHELLEMYKATTSGQKL